MCDCVVTLYVCHSVHVHERLRRTSLCARACACVWVLCVRARAYVRGCACVWGLCARACACVCMRCVRARVCVRPQAVMRSADVETKAQVHAHIGSLHLAHRALFAVCPQLAARHLQQARALALSLQPMDVTSHSWYQSAVAGLEKLAQEKIVAEEQEKVDIRTKAERDAFAAGLLAATSASHKDVRPIAEAFKKLRRRCCNLVTFACVRVRVRAW
jgi:hypothetical protein